MLKIATRKSELAVTQARFVGNLLNIPYELVYVQTHGDRDQNSSLSEIGGQGVFSKEVQVEVLNHRADIAVHSAKDLPTAGVDGLVIAGVPKREDPRDALVGKRLASIPVGGVVATSSRRRSAQLLNLRPDVTVVSARGNMSRRIAKASEVDAVFVAMAAMVRLELEDEVAEVLPIESFTPQVGQGTLAIECRGEDYETIEKLNRISDENTRKSLEAERAFLARLGAGCQTPVGAYAQSQEGKVYVRGFMGDDSGVFVSRSEKVGNDPLLIGTELADAVSVMSKNASLLRFD